MKQKYFLKNILLFNTGIAYCIFALSRMIIYFFNKGLFINLTNIDVVKYFFTGLRFDTVSILYLLLPYYILEMFPGIPNNMFTIKVKRFFFAAALILGVSLNLFDVVSVPFNLRRISYNMLFEYGGEKGKFILIINFIKTNPIPFLILVFLVLLIILYSKTITGNKMNIKSKVITSLIFIPLFILGVRGGLQRRPVSITTANLYAKNPTDAILLLNAPFEIFKTIGEKPLQRINFFSSRQADSIFKTKIEYKNIKPNKKNIVFFIMESFSKEFIGALNQDKKDFTSYTPFLDSLIKKSYTFKYSYANGRKSLDALPSCLLSIPELNLHYSFSQYSTNKARGVGSCLKELGYKTMFFHGGANGTMQFDSFSKVCGIDEYYGKNEYNNNNDYDGVWGIWDEPFFHYSINTISKYPQPFFSVIYSLSSHHPYHIPEKYKDKFKGSNILEIHKTIQYSDYALKKFFSQAKKKKWYSHTIFIITSDHVAAQKHRKEYLNEYGYFSVPIIIFTPDSSVAPNYDTTTVAQQIDIPATLLYLTGYNKPFFSFGKNLFHPRYNNAITYINNNYQLIGKDFLLQFMLPDVTTIYNIKKDPTLQIPLKPNKNNKVLFLKAFIQKYNNIILGNKTF